MNLRDRLGACSPFVLLVALAIVLICVTLMCSCASVGDAHTAAIIDAWKRISADGVITTEESTWFAAVLSRELSTGGGVNWLATLGSVAGSLLTGAIGLRVYHNQVVSPAIENALAPTAPDPK